MKWRIDRFILGDDYLEMKSDMRMVNVDKSISYVMFTR